MKTAIGNYTVETSGSMIMIKKDGQLVNATEGNPNDIKTSFRNKCATVSAYVAKLKR